MQCHLHLDLPFIASWFQVLLPGPNFFLGWLSSVPLAHSPSPQTSTLPTRSFLIQKHWQHTITNIYDLSDAQHWLMMIWGRLYSIQHQINDGKHNMHFFLITVFAAKHKREEVCQSGAKLPPTPHKMHQIYTHKQLTSQSIIFSSRTISSCT